MRSIAGGLWGAGLFTQSSIAFRTCSGLVIQLPPLQFSLVVPCGCPCMSDSALGLGVSHVIWEALTRMFCCPGWMGRMKSVLTCYQLVFVFGFSFHKHGLHLCVLEPERRSETMGNGGTTTDTTTGVTCTGTSPAGGAAGARAAARAEG